MGLTIRRDPESGLIPPILKALEILSIPVVLTVLATELAFLQRWLLTEPLSGLQWLAALLLALAPAVVIELDKAIRRWRAPVQPDAPIEPTLLPERAVAATEAETVTPVA
jgi:Ca2+-transporting ATPase